MEIKVSKPPLEMSDIFVCSHEDVSIGIKVYVMLKKEEEVPFKEFTRWLCLDTYRNQSENFFKMNNGLVYGKEETLDGFYGWTYSGIAIPDNGGEPDEELVERGKFLYGGKVLQTIHPVHDPTLRTAYAAQASSFVEKLKSERPDVVKKFFDREYWVRTCRVPPLGEYANLGISMDFYSHVHGRDKLYEDYLEWKKLQEK